VKGPWLQRFNWAVITETNRQLCLPKSALHAPTSDGYEPTRQLWESQHLAKMTLAEATELCRRSHRLAPFCNFNGNTFVAVIRQVISGLNLPPDQAAVFRSLAGHIVAGTATPEEQTAFSAQLDRLGTGPGFQSSQPS
jgi:hypothetical protein